MVTGVTRVVTPSELEDPLEEPSPKAKLPGAFIVPHVSWFKVGSSQISAATPTNSKKNG